MRAEGGKSWTAKLLQNPELLCSKVPFSAVVAASSMATPHTWCSADWLTRSPAAPLVALSTCKALKLRQLKPKLAGQWCVQRRYHAVHLISSTLRRQVREEAGELCETLERGEGRQRAASEAADLLYHALVLLNAQVPSPTPPGSFPRACPTAVAPRWPLAAGPPLLSCA